MSDDIVIHIHEDDEGMRNIYPAAGIFEASGDMETSETASIENAAPGGGWTDVHVIEPPKAGFAETALTLEAARAVAAAHLPTVSKFQIGYGENNPFGRSDEGANTYGYGNELFVRFEAKDGALAAIWYECDSTSPAEPTALRAVFLELNKATPIMIADYWNGGVGRVSDTAFMDRYFAGLLED